MSPAVPPDGGGTDDRPAATGSTEQPATAGGAGQPAGGPDEDYGPLDADYVKTTYAGWLEHMANLLGGTAPEERAQVYEQMCERLLSPHMSDKVRQARARERLIALGLLPDHDQDREEDQ